MGSKTKPFAQLIQNIEEVAQALDALAAVACSRAPVLLAGPKGPVIEFIAKALHHCSLRGAGPFVSARCGLYAGASLESRLFAGSVTRRAYVRYRSGTRINCVESARGGTLFIDQVQASTPMIQRELLRLITDHEYVDPSRGKALPADVRIVASAGPDLKTRCERGAFRTDLYDRLSTVALYCHKGKQGLEWLFEPIELLHEAMAAPNVSGTPHNHAILSQIRRHSWSPAVLALQAATCEWSTQPDMESRCLSVVSRLARRDNADVAEDTLQAVSTAVERCVDSRELFGTHMYDTLVVRMQRTLIRRVMAECNGAISTAAQVLGISSQLLEAKVREFGL